MHHAYLLPSLIPKHTVCYGVSISCWEAWFTFLPQSGPNHSELLKLQLKWYFSLNYNSYNITLLLKILKRGSAISVYLQNISQNSETKFTKLLMVHHKQVHACLCSLRSYHLSPHIHSKLFSVPWICHILFLWILACAIPSGQITVPELHTPLLSWLIPLYPSDKDFPTLPSLGHFLSEMNMQTISTSLS